MAGGLRETMAEFVERRRREVENFGQQAEAAAREAYGKAIRTGEDLSLPTQGDVMRYGANLLGGGSGGRADAGGAGVAGPPAPAARSATSPDGEAGGSWFDRSPMAKAAGGEAARQVGNAVGLGRGGVHAVEGLAEGTAFLARLANPLDALFSPLEETAPAQVVGAGGRVVDYVTKGVADPMGVVHDVQAKALQMDRDLNPAATPAASTFGGELRRNFDIGQNQGEAAFDVGSWALGGPLAKGARELGVVSKAARAEKYLPHFSPAGAAYLAEPYPASGWGHHFIPRSYEFPSMFGGGSLPRAYSDGPFNRLAPEGMTRGDFYERHFRVDPDFYGTKLPARVGGERWRGKALGLEKYGLPGRLYYGSPAPLKARVGGLTSAAGSVIYDASKPDQ